MNSQKYIDLSEGFLMKPNLWILKWRFIHNLLPISPDRYLKNVASFLKNLVRISKSLENINSYLENLQSTFNREQYATTSLIHLEPRKDNSLPIKVF